MKKIKELYTIRFNKKEREKKNRLWKIVCSDFFQRYIGKSSTVLDLGAGFCEFINNINCQNKYAVDINEEIRNFANEDVRTIITSGTDMKDIRDSSIDFVFASEFFEHLKSIEELFATFLEIHRILKKDGRFIVLCPNIRYLQDRYWDFIDHRLPLSHVSMREALLLYNFKVIKIVPKFLPYTTKSLLPKSPILLKIYLKLPAIWNFIGKQMLIIAQKD